MGEPSEASGNFGYERLEVWRESMDLVDAVCELTRTFPKEEVFGLTNQMRRAAISIPSNIAEGYAHGGKVQVNHLRHAIGSTFELRTQIAIAVRQKLAQEGVGTELIVRTTLISRRLDAFVRSIRPR